MNLHERQITGPNAGSGQVSGKRILLVASHRQSLANFRGPLIEDLIAHGHTVHVTAPEIDKVTQAAMDDLGAKLHDISLSRQATGLFANVRYFRALRQLMDRVKPDLVVNYTIKPNIWGSLAASSRGIRSVSMVTGLGLALAGGPSLRQKLVAWAARGLYRLATARNHKVVFQNPDDLKAFLNWRCLDDPFKACLVNGSGIDIDYFSPAPLPDRPVFLMICRLLASKGVMEYAAAAAQLNRRRPDARFLLVGFLDDVPDGITKAQLDACVANGIEFLGKKLDIRPAMEQASVYVLPSYYPEGTPRSVLEGMAMGRAIITTDMPGCRETTQDGVNGYLIPARNVQALTAAMETLITNPNLRTCMGNESRRIAVDKYDVRKVNLELMRHLELVS